MQDLLGNQLSGSSSYYIRDDSYTDSNTGVTHVYARQTVNGLEVADGHINLNIKDGLVLSYGNSVGLFVFDCSSSLSQHSCSSIVDPFLHPFLHH